LVNKTLMLKAILLKLRLMTIKYLSLIGLTYNFHF
jgi:hypothetical protein